MIVTIFPDSHITRKAPFFTDPLTALTLGFPFPLHTLDLCYGCLGRGSHWRACTHPVRLLNDQLRLCYPWSVSKPGLFRVLMPYLCLKFRVLLKEVGRGGTHTHTDSKLAKKLYTSRETAGYVSQRILKSPAYCLEYLFMMFKGRS